MKISVSYLSSIFDKKSTIRLIDNSNADMIHVDLMDGMFVPKRNFYIELCLQKNLQVEDLKKYLLEDLYEKCLLANKERKVYQRDYSKIDELISVSKMIWS